MKLIRNIKGIVAFSRQARLKGKSIGFVPTMGALHMGHLSLIKKSKKENDITIVSIFVNPIQFASGEDLKRYPRDLKNDALLCRKSGVDAIFCPQVKSFYPQGYKTYVQVEGLSDHLCGRFRPGHFRGVTTVVAKLFNLVSPDTAYFGQKDAQQALIIQKMAEDLNMPVKIRVLPTVRHKDGLAMSSRNAYLTKEERRDARVLYQALSCARALVRQGKKNVAQIIQQVKSIINKKKSARIQYVLFVDTQDLEPISRIKSPVLLALSVYIGKTRLIDNIVI